MRSARLTAGRFLLWWIARDGSSGCPVGQEGFETFVCYLYPAACYRDHAPSSGAEEVAWPAVFRLGHLISPAGALRGSIEPRILFPLHVPAR